MDQHLASLTSQTARVPSSPGLAVTLTSGGDSPSSRAPERSRSLTVVTVTVWLGWSYCTDSVFAVTSRSSSSASSVQGGHRTGPQPQGTSNQAPAPPDPGAQWPTLLYGRVCRKSLPPGPDLPINVVNDPTAPPVCQEYLRPLAPHLRQAQCNTRSLQLCQKPAACSGSVFLFVCFFKILFIFRERGREGEREGDINAGNKSMYERYINQLLLAHPQLGTWPRTQACDSTGIEPATFQAATQSTEPHQPGLLRISLPRALGLLLVSDPLTFRGTQGPPLTPRSPARPES